MPEIKYRFSPTNIGIKKLKTIAIIAVVIRNVLKITSVNPFLRLTLVSTKLSCSMLHLKQKLFYHKKAAGVVVPCDL
jgi:hypothetical protein